MSNEVQELVNNILQGIQVGATLEELKPSLKQASDSMMAEELKAVTSALKKARADLDEAIEYWVVVM